MVDVVSDVIINYKSVGLDKVGGEIKQTSVALDGLVVSATSSEKATASLENRFKSLERTFSTSTGNADKFARVQDSVNKAVAQNPELQGRANEVLANAAQKYGMFGKAVDDVATAHKGLDAQGQAALHSIRSLTEQLVMGASPIQALTGQLNHLTFAATGEGGIAGAFKQAGGVFASMITPTTAIAAGIAAVGAAAVLAASQLDKLQVSAQRAISGAGARTGTTVEDINTFVAKNAGTSTTGLSDKEARDLAEGFTKTGNIVISQLHGMSDAVVGFANQTGKSVTEASKAFEQFAQDPKKAVEDLGKVFGALDTSTQLAVDALVEAGNKTGAMNVIVDALSKKTKDAAENMTLWEKATRLMVTTMGSQVLKPSGLDTAIQKTTAQLNAAIESPTGMIGGMDVEEKSKAVARLTDELIKLQAAKENVRLETLAAEMADLANKAGDATKALTPQIAQIDALQQKIAELNRAKEAGVTSKYGADADKAALTAAQNQLQALKESQAEAARYQQRVAEIAAAWGNVSQSVALQLRTMQNNLPVAEAVGGAAKMAAQYAADYKNYMDQGKTAIEAAALAAANLRAAHAQVNSAAKETLFNLQNQAPAAEAVGGAQKMAAEAAATYNKMVHDGVSANIASAVAAQQLANAQAQVNSAAKETLWNLQNQAAAAGAVTAAEQMAAQAEATKNQLVHDGVTEYVAQRVAAQQLANAQAAANASVQKQVQSLEDSTRLINAQAKGMGDAAERSIAYDNAIRSGASATQAAALSSAMLSNQMAKAASNAVAMANAVNATTNSLQIAGGASFQQLNQGWVADHPFSGGTFNVPAGTQYTSTGSAAGYITSQASVQETVDKAYAAGGASAGIAAALGVKGYDPAMVQQYSQVGISLLDKTKVSGEQIPALDALFQLQNAQTQDKSVQAGNLQGELAILNTMPASIARDQKIADLKNSIDSLIKSTDSLNSTNQDLLSPYYTQDPRTSHIGFRSQGMAAGGYVDVPGGYSVNDNMLATIPVASGERIYVDPMTSRRGTAGGGMVVNISSPITIIGNANPDQFGRTVYQNNQQLAKQVRAATQ